MLFEQWTEECQDPELVSEYVFKLMNRLNRCQELAFKNMLVKREKRKFWYDRDETERNFEAGDEVLILSTSKPIRYP